MNSATPDQSDKPADKPAEQPGGKPPKPKSARRRSREFALQGLYEWLVSGTDAGVIDAHLRELGVTRMQLLGQPRRMPSMTGYGLEVSSFITAADPA